MRSSVWRSRFSSEFISEKAHDTTADGLAERMLAMLVAGQIECDRAELGLIFQEAITDARVEQIVSVEMKGLVDDLLLRNISYLLVPGLGRDVVEVERPDDA